MLCKEPNHSKPCSQGGAAPTTGVTHTAGRNEDSSNEMHHLFSKENTKNNLKKKGVFHKHI